MRAAVPRVSYKRGRIGSFWKRDYLTNCTSRQIGKLNLERSAVTEAVVSWFSWSNLVRATCSANGPSWRVYTARDAPLGDNSKPKNKGK